ncbi:hypothetical protein B0H11DRAFT_1910561 [Mycena galericulata]|nr:hypothetical protein B0H11DRAFT_1910561 [Mycena galericulata]
MYPRSLCTVLYVLQGNTPPPPALEGIAILVTWSLYSRSPPAKKSAIFDHTSEIFGVKSRVEIFRVELQIEVEAWKAAVDSQTPHLPQLTHTQAENEGSEDIPELAAGIPIQNNILSSFILKILPPESCEFQIMVARWKRSSRQAREPGKVGGSLEVTNWDGNEMKCIKDGRMEKSK